MTVHWIYLYLQFPEFDNIIGTILLYTFKKYCAILPGTVKRQHIEWMNLCSSALFFKHTTYFVGIVKTVLRSHGFVKMFTTVNSLNSINIIGHCTSQCMLPIWPFYRLQMSVMFKQTAKLLMLILRWLLLLLWLYRQPHQPLNSLYIFQLVFVFSDGYLVCIVSSVPVFVFLWSIHKG